MAQMGAPTGPQFNTYGMKVKTYNFKSQWTGVPQGYLVAGIMFDSDYEFISKLLLKAPSDTWKGAWDKLKCIEVDVSYGKATCPSDFLLKDIKLKPVVQLFEGAAGDDLNGESVIKQHDI